MEGLQEVSWNLQLEQLLKEEGEKALSLFWLHTRAEERYGRLNHFIALPVIFLSAINGATSVGSETLFGNVSYAPLLIGFLSIGVGLLNAVGTYFAWSRRAEGHKIASLSYQKLYKFIAVELALPRKERMIARDLLKIVREGTDRLAEISPSIPPSVILKYQDRFANHESAKPEVANGLHTIEVFPESQTVAERVRITIAEV